MNKKNDNNKKMPFAGKVVVITGASSGIGAAAAIHLSGKGANVVIVGRNAERVAAVAKQIHDNGSPRVLEIVADITTEAERIINETITTFGRLDVLVNNAGIIEYSHDVFGTLESFDRIMATNVRSVIALSKLAVPHLEKTKGNIVNVSSCLGSVAKPQALTYSISKAALNHLTRCAAVELGAKKIRVNAVCPSVIDTPLFETVGVKGTTRDAIFEDCKNTYPIGRAGVVSDTSAAIEFLAVDTNSFITGHLLYVDGGKHLVN